jgi:hypothetical protein
MRHSIKGRNLSAKQREINSARAKREPLRKIAQHEWPARMASTLRVRLAAFTCRIRDSDRGCELLPIFSHAMPIH